MKKNFLLFLLFFAIGCNISKTKTENLDIKILNVEEKEKLEKTNLITIYDGETKEERTKYTDFL